MQRKPFLERDRNYRASRDHDPIRSDVDFTANGPHCKFAGKEKIRNKDSTTRQFTKEFDCGERTGEMNQTTIDTTRQGAKQPRPRALGKPRFVAGTLLTSATGCRI